MFPPKSYRECPHQQKKGRRLAILELLFINIEKKWTSPGPSSEHLIFLELVHKRRGELSLNLPFSREYPDSESEDQWSKFLVNTLRRTIRSKKWFDKACRQDSERGTCLGTLGYLPPELRVQIWEQLSKGEGNIPLNSDTVLLDYQRSGPTAIRLSHGTGLDIKRTWINQHSVRQLREALGPTAYELDAVFFTRFIFRFNSPGMLKEFWKHFGPASSPFHRIEVDISNRFYRKCWQRCDYAFRPEWIDPRWLTAFDCSLPSIQSVKLNMGQTWTDSEMRECFSIPVELSQTSERGYSEVYSEESTSMIS